MKRRLSVLLVLAILSSATGVVAGPAAALPQGNSGHHYGEYSPLHEDNGKHIGAGVGAGKYSNEGLYRRGLR